MTFQPPKFAPLLLPMIVFDLDVLTKWWVQRTLVLQEPVFVLGDELRLTLAYNPHAAFGLFGSDNQLMALTGAVIVVMVAWVLGHLGIGRVPRPLWPVLLILGGMTANFEDRLTDGYVTDFIDVGFDLFRWPTFNLADTSIVVGVAMLLWLQLFAHHQPEGQHIPSVA